MTQKGERWLLTGERNSGKTRLLQQAVSHFKHNLGASAVEGLLSPGIFQDKRKVAIDLLHIRTGEKRRLARLRPESRHGLTTKHWIFDQEAIKWGNESLRQMPPAPLFLMDEIGPLELERATGLQVALEFIDSAIFNLAIVVIRPSLIKLAKARWRPESILNVDDFSDESKATAHLIAHVETFIHAKGIRTMNQENMANTQIAFASDDGESISSHFGRAQQYVVINLDQGNILKREVRPKYSPHAGGQGHQSGSQDREESRHQMVETILDCKIVVARGMGQGAQAHFERAGIKIVLTELKTIDTAIKAYLGGELTHHADRLHLGHGHQHDKDSSLAGSK